MISSHKAQNNEMSVLHRLVPVEFIHMECSQNMQRMLHNCVYVFFFPLIYKFSKII